MNQSHKIRCYDTVKKKMLPSSPIYKCCFYHYSEVEDLIIMLGSGIKDVEDKEIFEDDIVHYDGFWIGDHFTGEGIAFIEFIDGSFGLYNNLDGFLYELDSCSVHNLNIEVIGNLYKNPDILIKNPI